MPPAYACTVPRSTQNGVCCACGCRGLEPPSPSIHHAEVSLPELPDIVVYLEALAPRVLNQRLERLRIANPFLVRTPEPPISAVEGQRVLALRRMGKRIVFALEHDLFLVLHLMIAGRLRWKDRGAPIPGKVGLAAFDFPAGTAILTEAGSKRQASLHLVVGASGLAALDPGGLEVLESDLPAFAQRLTRVNHTLKRALTDPHIFSGIGNAYSDEILHAARLSPLQLTAHLSDEQIARLHESTVRTLERWIAQLRDELGDAFPDKVTAFRPEMAVHGKYRQPCPVCGDPVQRIVYARNESNYCATCQTGGKLLSDRALARLLRDDWPRTLEDMERRMRGKQEEGRKKDA